MIKMPHIRITEDELRRAAAEPNLRDAFYRRLLEADVLVQAQCEHARNGVVPAGEAFGVECWVLEDGTEVIPFFSSPRAFFRFVPSGGKCVVMETHELFESKRGAAFYLNPGSAYAVEFPPNMVDLLLVNRAIT